MSLANLFTDNTKEYQNINSGSISLPKQDYEITFPTTTFNVTTPIGKLMINYGNTINQGTSVIFTVNYPGFEPTKNVVMVTNLAFSTDERNCVVGIQEISSGSFDIFFKSTDPFDDAEVSSISLMYLVI